jgi:hypothetical protein
VPQCRNAAVPQRCSVAVAEHAHALFFLRQRPCIRNFTAGARWSSLLTAAFERGAFASPQKNTERCQRMAQAIGIGLHFWGPLSQTRLCAGDSRRGLDSSLFFCQLPRMFVSDVSCRVPSHVLHGSLVHFHGSIVCVCMVPVANFHMFALLISLTKSHFVTSLRFTSRHRPRVARACSKVSWNRSRPNLLAVGLDRTHREPSLLIWDVNAQLVSRSIGSTWY